MPDWKSIVRKRMALSHLEGAAEADLAEELAQHLEDRYRELRGGGADEEDAFQKTVAELNDLYPARGGFGRAGVLPRKDAVPAGDTSAGNFFGDLWRDLRYSGRMMRRYPVFVLFVVLTLGLGIGANTTVFTVINTLILHPLPVRNPSALTAVSMAGAANTSASKAPLPVSYPDLKDYQAKNGVFRSLAGYTSPRIVTLHVSQGSQRMFAELVTSNYFSTLGLAPEVGRFFAPRDSAPVMHAVTVINYATWQERFGGATGIVGKTLRLNNVVFTVIGVAPPGFIGVNAVFGPNLWIPAAMAERLLPVEMKTVLTARGKGIFQGVGRLKPGVSRKQAQADLATIAAALAREYPDADETHTVTVRPITDALFGSAGMGSASILFTGAVLLIVVLIVLLIACSNVANLLLARSVARQHEIAVRLAVGASRARLIRQLLTENVFLGLLSGIVGFGIGYGGLRLLWSFLPAEVSANLIAPKLDST
ncbi:MAG: ABC transporter permease, partial [Bryobacteraceae bacterium]